MSTEEMMRGLDIIRREMIDVGKYAEAMLLIEDVMECLDEIMEDEEEGWIGLRV